MTDPTRSAARRWAERAVGPLRMRRLQVTRPWTRLSVSDNVSHLAAQGAIPTAEDAPIFIMAATWRSGSTLLQRLVVSSGDVLVWGEPWNRCDLVGRLRRSFGPLDGDWPGPATTIPGGESADVLSERWIANLFPSAGDLVEAHRAMYRRLLADPAAELGRTRWGAKFVRLGLDDAQYLRFLFPAARFVFLIRDPVDAWRSYRAFNLHSYERWPDRPVITATHFGRLWRRRTTEFIDGAATVGGLVVRYEDLLGDASVLDAIDDHLGLTVDRSLLDSVVGSTEQVALDREDVWRLRLSIGSAAAAAGYRLPTSRSPDLR